MFWFTGDTHFGHRNILSYTERGKFFETVDQMDEQFIKNWNERVSPTDEVYHVGDFALCHPGKALGILARLHGRKHLIAGNHDKKQGYTKMLGDGYFRFASVSVRLELKVPEPTHPFGYQLIILDHYAMVTWNKSHHGSWQLHGHSHGSLKDDPHARRIDVGVDCHNYKPISYDEVKFLMSKKVFKPIDHHTGERD